jgi:phosphohistidine phosphatase
VKARLYIQQHGDALPKNEDAERPLSNKGLHDIRHMAEHMAEKDVLIQRIVHSGKLRAEQTAGIISEKLAPDVRPEAISGISPNDDPARFIENLGAIEGAVFVASHMPFVSNLCSTLLVGNPEAQFRFTPGAVACLGYEEDQWSLLCLVSPEDL